MNEKRCIAVVVGFATVIGGLMIYAEHHQPPLIPAPVAAPVPAPEVKPNTPLIYVEPNTPIIYVEVKSAETKETTDTHASDEGNFQRLDRIIERSDAVLNP